MAAFDRDCSWAGLCHGFRTMAIWQFAALFGGWCWLTLPHGFPHKRADRDPFEKGFRGLYVSTAFVSPAFAGAMQCPGNGGVSRVAKGADCKSAASWLRRFESFLPHQPSLASRATARQASSVFRSEASEGCRAEAQKGKAGLGVALRGKG